MSELIGDVALSGATNGGVQVNFPRALARALKEKGYNRATIALTNEGILFRPYVADDGSRAPVTTTDLPDWSATA